MKITPNILKKWLEEEYDGRIFKQSDTEWVVPSFRNPKKMKCYINLDKGVAMDFIGGEGYSPFEVIKKLGEYPDNKTTHKAVEKFVLKNISSIDLSDVNEEQPHVKEEPKPVVAIDMPDGFIPITSTKFLARQGADYMLSRGFTRRDLEKYHLMVGTKGDYTRRVIIPFIENNEIVWFQGRSWSKAERLKYRNPVDVSKSVLVYNIDGLREGGVAILTEGPLDAMMVGGQSTMGAQASDWQVNKILAKKPKRIIIVPDNDTPKIVNGEKFSPGYSGALSTIDKLVGSGYNIRDIYVAFIEGGKDLNEIGKKKAQDCILNATPMSVSTMLKFREYGATNERLQKLL